MGVDGRPQGQGVDGQGDGDGLGEGLGALEGPHWYAGGDAGSRVRLLMDMGWR